MRPSPVLAEALGGQPEERLGAQVRHHGGEHVLEALGAHGEDDRGGPVERLGELVTAEGADAGVPDDAGPRMGVTRVDRVDELVVEAGAPEPDLVPVVHGRHGERAAHRARPEDGQHLAHGSAVAGSVEAAASGAKRSFTAG